MPSGQPEVDRIIIPGIPLRAHVGVTAEERDIEQDIVVGVVLHLDLAPAGTSDDLAKTVDYDAVCETASRVVASRPFDLIEAIAEEVAQAISDAFDVVEVDVRVEKPGALTSWNVPFAAVEIRRTHGDSR
jgi:dihydroneopterin aldolase